MEEDFGPLPPPPIGSEADPFFAFRDELAQSSRTSLAQLEKLKQAAGQANPKEFSEELTKFSGIVATLKENIGHLEKVILHVERKRHQFSHLIGEEDLKARRRFLRIIQAKCRYLETELDGLSTQNAQRVKQLQLEEESKQRKQLLGETPPKKPQPSATPRKRQVEPEGLQRVQHEQMMKEQDQSLEEISSTLGRLKQVGDETYHEIEAQNRMLDEMIVDTAQAESKMGSAMNRLDKALQTSSRGHTCAIIILVCVLLAEILLVSII